MKFRKTEIDEPLSPEDAEKVADLTKIGAEARAERAATESLPAVPAAPAQDAEVLPMPAGRHASDPLAILARLRADVELAGLEWHLRPAATGEPSLLGTHVVLDIDHLRDAATVDAATGARRMIEHFAAQSPVSPVVGDEEPGLRGRPRKVSTKRIGGVAVTVAITLPKDTPLSVAAPPTTEFEPVPESAPVATADPSHPNLGPMFARPEIPAAANPARRRTRKHTPEQTGDTAA